jgi:hypothetical protein
MYVKGRYPAKSAMFPYNMLRGIEYDKELDAYIIRLDDKNNLDFWMEITVSQDELDIARKENA